MTASCLDHLGVAGADAAALHGAYERLGFCLTPLARQHGRLRPDGPVVPFGTANRCAMLGDGYLELLAVVDAAAPLNGLDGFLARYPGAHILALGTDDAAAELSRLRAAGLDLPGVLPLQRPVDDADPDGPQARFARLPLPDAPEGRVQLVQHLTPEAIWQPRFLDHPNRAVALETAVLATAHPADSAARLSRLAGRPVVPDPAGGFRLVLPRGAVRILPAEALGAVLPGVTPPALPFLAGAVIRTADGAAALRGRLGDVPHRDVPDGVLVLPDAAGGAALVFH